MRSFRLPLALGLLALSGCNVIPPPTADQTRYFVLTSPVPEKAEAADSSPNSGLRIGLRSIELPGYLKTPDIIVRRGSNELALEDFDRWAEPLDAGIARLVRDRLRQDAAVGRIYQEPFPLDADRDYDIAVSVRRCEGDPPGAAFEASVEISTAGSSPVLVARQTYVAPAAAWDGRDYGQLAALLSSDIDALAQQIVSMLPKAPPSSTEGK